MIRLQSWALMQVDPFGRAGQSRLISRLALRSGSRLWRNFRLVAQANVLSQVILIAAAPVLTRLFTPEAFGVVTLFSVVMYLIASVAGLRFDWLLPNTRTEAAAASLFAAGMTSTILVAALCMSFLHFPPKILSEAEWYADLGDYVLLLPIGVMGLGMHQLFQGWYVRLNDLRPVNRTKVMQSLANVGFSLMFGAFSAGALGLVLAALIGSWFGLSVLVRHAAGLLEALRRLTLRRIRVTAWKWRREASLSTIVSLVNTASGSAVVIALAFVYSSAEIGLYAFIYRLVTVPIGVISAALAQSFWAHTADLARKHLFQKMETEYLKVTIMLTGLAVVLSAVLYGGSFLLLPIFGADWAGMDSILRMIIPMLFAITVFSPTNHLVVLNRQGMQLFADLVRLSLIILTVVLASRFGWRFDTTLLYVSLSSVLGYLVLFSVHIWAHKSAQKLATDV